MEFDDTNVYKAIDNKLNDGLKSIKHFLKKMDSVWCYTYQSLN